jgi:putative hemolysin
MNDALLCAAAVVLLLACAFYSGAEMGVYVLNRVRLRLRAESPSNASARALLSLESNRQESVLAILLWQNICGYLLTVVTSTWLEQAGVPITHVEFYSAIILSPIIFVFGDVVPKNWFRVQADSLMYRGAGFLRASIGLLRTIGLTQLLLALSRRIARLLGIEAEPRWVGARGEVLGLLREGAAEGVLTEEQTQIVERVLNLARVRVRSIMIPRSRVVTVPLDTDRASFERIARSHSFSRMPVLSRERDAVLGIVRVADVLAEPGEGRIAACMHPPITLDASDSATGALVTLQRARQTMAVVLDDHKEFVGIVTLKDVVEEIFGELPAW